ncbi:hypothetical protein [uncultured Georgenia sp.]|uniref:hypothetical protein n=1 Tax=uncultured Georgenia sp. TaxID=378209 RepID=UPI002616271C|nr:hypothetical protein [uncultured Georgenia sp.]HLV04891.1 hypothetical protein [Actinomycetaceae bacterium]
MPLFEFEAGQLIPAQVGHAVTDPVEPAVLEAVRTQVLEILRLPVLPVTWHDDDGTPRLTAMDPVGNVVSIEVLDRLDARSLVAALGRAGRCGQRGWIDVARSYPSGVGAFRRDWNAFRESQPVGTAVASRVHVVAAHIDDDVRLALDALAGAGVVVHQLVVRTMSNGRLFLDVAEVTAHVAPLPWLLPARAAAALEQTLGSSAGAVPPPPSAPAAVPGASLDVAAPAARPAPQTPQAPADTPAAAEGEEEFRRICASLGGPTPLVWVHDGQRHEATLLPEGRIVVGEERFSAPEEAAAAVARGRVPADPWSAWRFGEHGPSLREAREELRALRDRPGRRTDQSGPVTGVRRRARRRRAATE